MGSRGDGTTDGMGTLFPRGALFCPGDGVAGGGDDLRAPCVVAMLKPGDRAPNFVAPTDDGHTVALSDYVGKKVVVLYFYPRDETMGCTREACLFRDHWEEIQSRGAELLGISSDPPERHQRFRAHHQLPFPLLSDPKGEIREAFGVAGGLIPPRATFVIDEGRVVRMAYRNQWNVGAHVRRALEALGEPPRDPGRRPDGTPGAPPP